MVANGLPPSYLVNEMQRTRRTDKGRLRAMVPQRPHDSETPSPLRRSQRIRQAEKFAGKSSPKACCTFCHVQSSVFGANAIRYFDCQSSRIIYPKTRLEADLTLHSISRSINPRRKDIAKKQNIPYNPRRLRTVLVPPTAQNLLHRQPNIKLPPTSVIPTQHILPIGHNKGKSGLPNFSWWTRC